MLVLILVTVAIAGYSNWRRANIGLPVVVPAPLDTDCEVPGFLQEYADGTKVREHDRNYPPLTAESMIEELRQDLSKYRRKSEYVEEDLLLTHRGTMVKMARTVLEDEESDFKSAATAAWILNETGDPNALSDILRRATKHDARDDEKRWELFDIFPSEKLVSNSQFLKAMKASARDDSGFGRRSALALFETGLDREIMVRRMLLEASEESESNYPLQWLLRNDPSVEALEMSEAYLFDSAGSVRSYSDYHLIRTILMTDFSHAPERKEVAERIERKFGDLIRKLRKQDEPEGGHLGWQLWSLIVHNGSENSKTLFLETLANAGLSYRHSEAVAALVRLGHAKECSLYMTKAVEKLPPKSPDAHLKILNLHEQCCGREASIEVCWKLAEDQSNYAAFEKLAMLFEDTSDPMVSDLIRNKLFQKGSGKYAVQALWLLEQIGNSDLPALWAKLPKTTTSNRLVKFYQHWHTQGVVRADVVNWVNQKLKPENLISIDSVLNESKFFSGPGEHYLWRFVHEGFDSNHKFVMAALAHSGSGDLAFGEDMYFDQLIGCISDLAKTESEELKVSSLSSHVVNNQRTFRMVVNKRLYEFVLTDDVNKYEDRYDARAIVEILNAIAIRQGQKKRFFAYPTEWDIGFCLILFIDRETVAELEAKFGLIPIQGSEYYLEH